MNMISEIAKLSHCLSDPKKGRHVSRTVELRTIETVIETINGEVTTAVMFIDGADARRFEEMLLRARNDKGEIVLE